MNCEQAMQLLSGHLDGQNTTQEEEALHAHLKTCASCRELLEAFEAVNQGVAQLEAEPPAELLTGVMQRIRAEQNTTAKPKKRRFFFGPGTAVAAVAAMLLLVLGMGDLKNLQLGQANTAGLADQQSEVTDTAPQPRTAQSSLEDAPAVAAADAGDSPQINVAVAGEDAAAQQTEIAPKIRTSPGPAQFAVLPEDEQTPKLVIVENPEKPALETITELAGLETVTDEQSIVWYVSDVQTALALEVAYAGTYAMEPYLLAADALPDAVCMISIEVP